MGRLIATLFAVSLITFLMVEQLPGDPILAILPPEALDDLENIERIRKELRLDDSVVTRYFRWVGDALQGDLGKSYITDQPVSDAIKDRIQEMRVLILNSPLNPTGTCFSRDELKDICDVIVEENQQRKMSGKK